MNIYFFWSAALVSFITFGIHTFIGGPRVAAPLLASTELPRASKWLNYCCWHITTLYVFAMACAYVYIALNPECPELVVFLSIVSVFISILSASVAVKGGINPLRFPSTTLFAIISLLGLLGLLNG